LGNVAIHEKVILKWILDKYRKPGCGMNSRYLPIVACSYGHDNNILGFIMGEEFLD
jgi:hypothetical protein